MKQEFLIDIRNRQKTDDEIEEIALTTRGTYTKRNGKRYIVYEEYDQENQTTEVSSLKIETTDGRKLVTLQRNSSENRTNLFLEEGKRHLCQYGTPFGCISLGVYTSKIEDTLTDAGGVLVMEYTLDVNTNLTSINQITITVTPIAEQ